MSLLSSYVLIHIYVNNIPCFFLFVNSLCKKFIRDFRE
nr:MAG TPA: hypothetical protein [Caudoviricetes sp.]